MAPRSGARHPVPPPPPPTPQRRFPHPYPPLRPTWHARSSAPAACLSSTMTSAGCLQTLASLTRQCR
eukprot:247251-Chlamydomonas_euryale.AAC.2